MKPKPLKDRIAEALRDGPLGTYDLARILWPLDTCPTAWRVSANGGPPGWVLPLGAAIKRLGLRTWHEKGKRVVAMPRNT